MKHGPVHTSVKTGSRFRLAKGAILPCCVSAAVILSAIKLSQIDLFERMSLVVSDYISRGLGATQAEHVALVRLQQSFTKPDLQRLLSAAIPGLISTYQAAAVGVDIDFSGSGYTALAKDFGQWSAEYPDLAKKVVWAVGYERPSREAPEPITHHEPEACEQCTGISCRERYTPKPVFGDAAEPNNYGLAIAFPDRDGSNRWSARFVCHSDSEKRLPAFHFKLVELYCAGSDMATCGDLQPLKQERTTIHSWFHADPIDLCSLFNCQPDSSNFGTKTVTTSDALAHKVVILYSDTPGNDEHMTFVGSRKGAEIIGSLVENELRFGVGTAMRVSCLKWTLEIILTVFLLFLFHWRYTKSWAIIVAAGVFCLYLWAVPRLATVIPDFRNYVLAIILAFWIEVMVKSAWQSIAGAVDARRAKRTTP